MLLTYKTYKIIDYIQWFKVTMVLHPDKYNENHFMSDTKIGFISMSSNDHVCTVLQKSKQCKITTCGLSHH